MSLFYGRYGRQELDAEVREVVGHFYCKLSVRIWGI